MGGIEGHTPVQGWMQGQRCLEKTQSLPLRLTPGLRASRKCGLTESREWPHRMLKACPAQSPLQRLSLFALWFHGFKETLSNH